MNIQYEVDNSKRNIGLDMLRIIAMAMIVAFHYQIHVSNDTAMFTSPSWKQALLILFGSWGVYGSNYFGAVSAYYLSEKKTISYTKILELFIKTSIFATVLYLFVCFGGFSSFSFINLMKCILAVFTYQYWFVSAWIIMALIFPLINKAIESLDKNTYSILLIVLFLFFFIYASIFGFDLSGRLGCAIWIYLSVNFIKKYYESMCINTRAWTLILLICLFVNISYELLVEMLNLYDKKYIYIFENGASPTAAIGAIALLFIGMNFKFDKTPKAITKVIIAGGKHSIGIFLICFPAVVSRTLVYDTFMLGNYFYKQNLVTWFISYILTICLVCIVGIGCDFFYEITIGNFIKKRLKNKIGGN